MTILVFDCETTGLINYKTQTYPHIVQLSWIVYSDHITEHNHIIRPTIPIPEESIAIHQITQERANKEGIPIEAAIYLLSKDWNNAHTIVAHNLSFDLAVLKKECERTKLSVLNYHKPFYCTMKNSIELCNLVTKSTRNPDETYLKYPKLIELFHHLFPTETISNLHDALVDNIVCLRCYYMMTHHTDLCDNPAFKERFASLT